VILGGGDDACPVWEKDALHTASSWPRSVMISWPVVTSQRRAVQSSEAVAIRAPSGQKDALDSAPSWPRSAMISRPVVASRGAPCSHRRRWRYVPHQGRRTHSTARPHGRAAR